MKGIDLNALSDADLMREFSAVSKEFGSAVLDCESARARRIYSHRRRIEDALKARGRKAREHLVPLLDDDDRLVRYYAAKHLFAIVPDRARRILEENAAYWFDPIAADARMLLDMVDAGQYEPD